MLGAESLQAAVCLSVELCANNRLSEWSQLVCSNHISYHGKATVDSDYMHIMTLQAVICLHVDLHAKGTPPMQLQQQAESVLRCMLGGLLSVLSASLWTAQQDLRLQVGWSTMYDGHEPKGNNWPFTHRCNRKYD